MVDPERVAERGHRIIHIHETIQEFAYISGDLVREFAAAFVNKDTVNMHQPKVIA